MFFEPLPAKAEPTAERRPALPAWSAPPSSELGAVVAVEQMVAQSANVAVVLPTIRAYRSGCTLEVEVVSRQGALSEEDWWNLSMAMHWFQPAHGDRLPDKLLRMGVRYSDGAKATTIERQRGRMPPSDEPPPGPLLSWWPRGGGPRGGGVFSLDQSELWLWPLPPAEAFEFAVEWPLGGIDLTIVELDGAAIATAAERSTNFWPDSGASPEPT